MWFAKSAKSLNGKPGGNEMITFLIAMALLIAGYFVYGKIVEKNFGPDDRITPARAVNDGVDFVPLPLWKAFLIQMLNIAGTGPIFGALSGALFGPIVYLWIVFGCILGGSVHDYMCGMLSERNNGASLSELTGKYLGNGMLRIMRVFSVLLLVACGTVMTTGPAELLGQLTQGKISVTIWLCVITLYYFIATFVPIDKVIGKLYPLFGICLIAMALGISGSLLFSGKFVMPELWSNFANMHANQTAVWPFMFVTVACGAISGFHATQSPMMARCIQSEKQGHIVFYGAMITEGIIALIWAAAGVSCYESSQALLAAGGGCSAVVYAICQTTLGKVGSVLALIGVIVCPISSGDTSYRAARLTLADWFKLDQSRIKNRILLTVPLLAAGVLLCNLDYSVVWRYFSWSNQTIAMIVLWMATVYLMQEKKNYLLTMLPAAVMSAVSATYFVAAPECLGLLWNSMGVQYETYYPIGIAVGLLTAALFTAIALKKKGKWQAL